jgi:hypothetical protein
LFFRAADGPPDTEMRRPHPSIPSHPLLSPSPHSRDYAIACCNEAAQARAARKGRIPTLALPKPAPTADSWPRMWAKHLHWQAWKLDRQGGGQGVRPV